MRTYRALISLAILLLPANVGAIYVEQGTWAAATSNGTQTVTLRGSFTPQCGIILWTLHNTTGYRANGSVATAMGKFGSGFPISGDNWIADNVATSATWGRRDSVSAKITTDATIQGGLLFTSATAGSFTITWGTGTSTPDSAYDMYYLVVGGVTDCGCGRDVGGTADGSVSINVGTQPDLVLAFNHLYAFSSQSFSQANGGAMFTFGAATDTTNQWTFITVADDAAGASNSYRRFDVGRIHEQAQVGLKDSLHITYFGAFESNGWRWTHDDRGGSDGVVPYMWIKGGSYLVGNTTTPAATGTQTITTTFQPNGLLLATAMTTSTGAYADDWRSMVGIGSDASGNENALFVVDDDAADPMDANTNNSATKVFSADDNFDGTMSAEADIGAFNTTDVGISWTAVPASAVYYGYIVFGPPTVSTTKAQVMHLSIQD